MQIVIDIPDEQVKKSLEESKYIHEDEGVKGSVHIVMLYTNAQLEFVEVERKTDFYSCEYKVLPKGHGNPIDADELDEYKEIMTDIMGESDYAVRMDNVRSMPTIIEADRSDEE